jgi:hypothetical protein
MQDERIVVLLVVRRIHERDGAFAREPAQAGEFLGLRAEFPGIATAELLPARRIVGEPLPQCGAGRELLRPFVERRRRLAHPARPQTVNQDADAIVAGGFFVGSL